MIDNDYLFSLQNSDEYEPVREIARIYLEKETDPGDFTNNYYRWVTNCCLLYAGYDVVIIEKHFLWYLTIALKEIQNKIVQDKPFDTEVFRLNRMKVYFIRLQLQKLLITLNNKDEIKSLEDFKNNKTKVKSSKLSINGEPINNLERFLIANEVFQIEKKLRSLKVSEAEKHNLLSIILNCNIDNAKKIMNGSYDAKVKEDLLAEYYKTLNL